MIRAFSVPILLCILASCAKPEESAIDVKLLSTDIHISVAEHALVLPFVALDDYAYRKQSFSLNRERDSENAKDALNQFLYDSKDPKRPLVVDGLSIVMRTYGWNDADIRQRQVCPQLTREWARSACDNPWAAIQQALPENRFRLVDLRSLQIGNSRSPANCLEDGKPRRPLPRNPGQSVMLCAAQVFGGSDDQYHHAVVRIDGDLGALWMVWRYGQNGETAEAMTERQGKAIVSFVQNSLGSNENFHRLNVEMCRLRRPGSVVSPGGSDCARAKLGRTQ